MNLEIRAGFPCSLVICTISPTVLVGICTKTLNMY